MTVYIGVDFHPYEQTVAYASDEDGEIGYRRFLHGDKQSIRAFYRKIGKEAVIGVEATGCLWWFSRNNFIDDPIGFNIRNNLDWQDRCK